MPNTPKRNSFFIADGKYAVNTTARNPRAVEQEAAVLLAAASRDSFYGLIPVNSTTEEDTRAYALTLAKGVGASAAEILALTPYRSAKTLWRLADDRMAKGKAFWEELERMPDVKDNQEAAAYLAQRLPDLQQRYDAARQKSLEAVRLTRQKQERFLETMHLTQDEKDNRLMYMFGAGAGSLTASVFGGIYFKAPKAMALLFGLTQAQTSWEEATENGVPRAKAAGTAALAGGAEALLESVGLNRLERAFEASKGVKRILGSALTEFVQEGSQQTAEEIIMQNLGGRVQTALETFKSIALSAAMGGVLGAGAGGVHTAFLAGVRRLKKLGAPKETARVLAAKAVEAGTSPQMAEEAARMAVDQENPVNWPDNDILKGQEELRRAMQKQNFAQAYEQIEARAREKFQAAGLTREEAALGAIVERNVTQMQAAQLGLTPELAEKSVEISFNRELSENDAKVRFISEIQTLEPAEQEAFYKTSKMTDYREMLGELETFRAGITADGGQSFAQAAAMYRNSAKSLTEFVDFAIRNNNNPKEQNKSVYEFITQDGAALEVPFERAVHIYNDHHLTPEQLTAAEQSFRNFEYAYLLPGVGEYNGKQIKIKTNTSIGKMGAVLEFLPNGRIFVDTVFFDSDANIDNWAKGNPPNAPSARPVFIGEGINSIADIAQKIKGRTEFNQDVRGKTVITSKDGFFRALITAGQAADKSTFAHELAHVYLTAFEHIYDHAEYASQRERLDKWLGRPRGGVYSRAQQEKFAEGFEQFLKEGNAPAPYLQSVFEKFRAWIINVYNGADISKLSAAAREAYADMLASQAADAKNTVAFYQSAKKDFGRIRATLDKIKAGKTDVKDLEGVDLEALRDFVGILKKPAPALPKRHLLTDLRRYGAQYANAGRIDKEAYKNARVYDKATGVGDKPADWLVKHGYMEDAAVETYEEAAERDAAASELIERALAGEPVYRLEDRARVELHDAYREAVNMAEDAIGADYQTYEKLLADIDGLRKRGYRVVEKSDLDFIQEKFEELANLRESEAFLEREESFGRVDDAARGSADERRKEKVQKAKLENLRKAQAVKKAAADELAKRRLSGKDEMLARLENAKTVEEIYQAADYAFNVLEEAYGNTEAGRAEAGRMAPPAQDWDARRVDLLKDLVQINQKTDAAAAWAFAAIERKGLIVPHKSGLTQEAWNVPAAVSEKQRKINLWKAEQILDEQLRNRYYKAFEKALGGIEGLKTAQKSILLRSFNLIRYRNKNAPEMAAQIMDEARRYVDSNYKKYMAQKMEEIVKTPLFEKSGSLRTAKYSLAAQDFLKRAYAVMTLDAETALNSYEHAVKNQNYDDAPDKKQILLNRLLQFKAAPESMTPADVKELYDDMRALQKAGRDEVRLEKFLRNTREDLWRERLIGALEKQKMGKGAVLYVKKLANWQSLLNTLFGEAEFDADAGGKMGKEKVKFMDALSLEQKQIQMQNHVRRLRQETVKRVGDAWGLKTGNDYIKKINELQSETYTFQNYGEIPEGPGELLTARQKQPFTQTVNKLELMFFYIQSQNPLNRLRLMRAYREAQYETMFDPLTAADKKACRALMDIANSTYDQMNEVHKRERGFTLGRVENYFPNRTERLTGGLDYLREMLAANAAPSAVKARVQTVLAVEKPVNPVSLLMSEINRNAQYIYGAEDAGMLRRIFRDAQMARALEEKFGRKEGRDIYEHILKMIDLNGPGARVKQNGQFFEKLEFLFNNWVKSAIGLKPIVAIKQFASAFNYAEEMPVSAWTAGFKEALLHPRETLRFMRKFSPYLVTRYEEGSMNETLGRALAQDDVFGPADRINTLTNAITANVRLGDLFALAFGGKPYVDWLMKEKGYSAQRAREAFELATVRAQQANLKSTLNEAQLDGGNLFWRAAWAFRNQQMQYARKLYDAYSDYTNGYISAEELGKKLFIFAVVQPALYTLLSLGWFAWDEDDREDDLWRLAAAPVEQTLGAVPFGDDLTELLFNNLRSLAEEGKLSGMRSYELPGIVDMTRTLNKLARNFNDKDASLADWLDALAELGQFSGFGTKQIKGQINGVKDILGGKPVKGAMQVIGYTENRAKKVTGDEDE